ncbi:hypothetical protein TNCV_4745401 [Trichonephila clavipes]|nr:hypothetical protein TNCV_4745401 [Trichonephila clavipes]
MAPHRPRKSAPTEYATDEEDITYDVEDELEVNPADTFVMGQYCSYQSLGIVTTAFDGEIEAIAVAIARATITKMLRVQ